MSSSDALERMRQVAAKNMKAPELGATEAWTKRVHEYHLGLIDDDRVTCEGCKKYKPPCRERLGGMPNLLRRCIRWEPPEC